MRTHHLLFIAFILLSIVSCSKDDEATINPNESYTLIQKKALSILNGVWISNEIKEQYKYQGFIMEIPAIPSDTLVFETQFPSPKTFYTYDYLQEKEIENFIACGTCELRGNGMLNPDFSKDCYFYVSPSGNALHLYNIESERLVKSYDIRIESASRFYAGAHSGVPIIFNKQ